MIDIITARLRKYLSEGNYDLVVEELGTASKKRSLTTEELVLRGRSVLLGSGSRYSPDDAERDFLTAVEIDGNYVPGLLELGWFYFSVLDDPRRALPFFKGAQKASEDFLKEATRGRQECMEEIDRNIDK